MIMTPECKKYYEKTTELLLGVFKRLWGTKCWMGKEDLSDRKSRILVKEIGKGFSKENIVICEKFLIFVPSIVISYDSLYSYYFDGDVVKNRIINFKEIEEIKYELMPCRTAIELVTKDGRCSEIFNDVPDAKTYSEVKSYENFVHSGAYKCHTICFLTALYALTALYRCGTGEYEKTYLKIEKNINLLIENQKNTEDFNKKYGDFDSFDFVSCRYDFEEVNYALDEISSVAEEVRETESIEKKNAL